MHNTTDLVWIVDTTPTKAGRDGERVDLNYRTDVCRPNIMTRAEYDRRRYWGTYQPGTERASHEDHES